MTLSINTINTPRETIPVLTSPIPIEMISQLSLSQNTRYSTPAIIINTPIRRNAIFNNNNNNTIFNFSTPVISETINHQIKKKLIPGRRNTICCICLENTSECQTECGHIFHTDCITHVITNKCPMCRTNIF